MASVALSLDEVREITDWMREQGVSEFALGPLRVKFDPTRRPSRLEDVPPDERMRLLREETQRLADQAKADLFWSTDLPVTDKEDDDGQHPVE